MKGEREFYDVIEFWSGRMMFGNLASFDLLREQFGEMAEGEQQMAATFLRQLTYDRFLDTRYWYAIRQKVNARTKSCEVCSRDGERQVHHRSYRNHGEEHVHLEDLISICKVCHRRIHEAEVLLKSKGGVL